jgi:phosphoribosylformimino-5-aminoimidazole carboxamide ribotide isomerase
VKRDMLAIPAIDVLDEKVVRLLRGEYADVTVYADDPAAVAHRYVAAGANRIHLVDLDGARSGAVDLGLVSRIGDGVPDLQVGGGIRTVTAALGVLAAGASRVVVGSLAVHDPDELGRLVTTVGDDRVVVALDVRDGRARGEGWEDDGVPSRIVAERALAAGVTSLLVTGIDRDGTMAGPDLELLSEVRAVAPGVEIIASGGVSSLSDLDAAHDAGADAAVVGKALLEGAFTIEELMGRFGS